MTDEQGMNAGDVEPIPDNEPDVVDTLPADDDVPMKGGEYVIETGEPTP